MTPLHCFLFGLEISPGRGKERRNEEGARERDEKRDGGRERRGRRQGKRRNEKAKKRNERRRVQFFLFFSFFSCFFIYLFSSFDAPHALKGERALPLSLYFFKKMAEGGEAARLLADVMKRIGASHGVSSERATAASARPAMGCTTFKNDDTTTPFLFLFRFFPCRLEIKLKPPSNHDFPSTKTVSLPHRRRSGIWHSGQRGVVGERCAKGVGKRLCFFLLSFFFPFQALFFVLLQLFSFVLSFFLPFFFRSSSSPRPSTSFSSKQKKFYNQRRKIRAFPFFFPHSFFVFFFPPQKKKKKK